MRAREVAGAPISPGFLARTVTGEAVVSAGLGLGGRPSLPTAAPRPRRAAPGGSQLPPVCPAPRCPRRRALSGTASFCKYSGGPPSAPGRAGGSVRCGPPQEAAPRRVPTARAVRPSTDPEPGAGLPGREPAHAPRPQDEASGERSGPRTSPHSRAGLALLRPRLGVASSAGTEDPELSLWGWEPQARPPGGVVALGLPDTHERISHKRLWAGFT